MKAVGVLLEGTVKENSLKKQLAEAGQDMADATTRATVEESSVTVLHAEITKKIGDVIRLTTDLATVNARNAELERDMQCTQHDLNTA